MTIKLAAHYYEQFDADYTLDIPAESFEGWKSAKMEIAPEHTAIVLMHGWDTGMLEQYPGWYRMVEYLPRAEEICRTIFPQLLSSVRGSGIKLFHVVGGGDYYKDYPGYSNTVRLAGPESAPFEKIESEPILDKLRKFKVQLGNHNAEDVQNGFENLDFAKEAKPVGDEGIAKDTHQLFALCKEHGVNHLIYAGFAVNWCLLLSPGGMAEMSKHGVMCSVLRQAVTAVENKETARGQICKQIALWRVALAFGYVFDVDDLIRAIDSTNS